MAHAGVSETTHPTPGRHLAWDACYNARDTGGYVTIDGATIRWRALLRADNLCRLTPEGCAALAAYGVRTIMDLRTEQEVGLAPHPFGPEAAAARESGVAYRHMPVVDPRDPGVEEGLAAASTVEQSYLRIVELCRARLGAIVGAVARADDGGVLVHCHAGKDRTGLVVALLLRLAGVAPEVVAADYALSDTHLVSLYESERATVAGDAVELERLTQWQVSPPGAILAVLAHLDQRYGGAEGYVRAGGVTAEEIERVRRRLRA